MPFGAPRRRRWCLVLPLELSGARFPEHDPLDQRAVDLVLQVVLPLGSPAGRAVLECQGRVDIEGLVRERRVIGQLCLRLRGDPGARCDLRFFDDAGSAASLTLGESWASLFSLSRMRGELCAGGTTWRVELRADWRQVVPMVRGIRIEPPALPGGQA